MEPLRPTEVRDEEVQAREELAAAVRAARPSNGAPPDCSITLDAMPCVSSITGADT
jgi:hypothetical protein